MGIKGEDSAAIRITATTLGDLLLKGWDKGRDKDALIFPGERKNYDDLVAGVLRRARGLKALGIGRGDHVGILLPSSIEFVETLFANAMCGAVSVLMNARYKAPEMAYVAQNADLRAIVTNDLVTEHVDFGAQLV